MLLGSAHMPCLKQMQRGGVEWSFQGLKEGEGEHAARLLPPLWDPHSHRGQCRPFDDRTVAMHVRTCSEHSCHFRVPTTIS